MAKETGKHLAGRPPENRNISGKPPNKTPGNTPGKKPGLTLQQKLLIAGVIVLALALVAVLAYRSLFVRPDLEKPSGDRAVEEETDWGEGIRPRSGGERKSADYYTVLILGRDTGGGGNTDTILLASYDVTNQKATVMSIPRDTMVNIPNDIKKINSVYNNGGGGEKGVRYLYQKISQLVGFEPDYQVIVEWEAVGKIVETMGGVWFDVPYTMDYHDALQGLAIEQEKGYRLLNGDDAMQVIRWRKNDKTSPHGYHQGIGDTGRMQIQQDFLKALMGQMMKPDVLPHLREIIQVFQENVETDLTFQNILWFGQKAFFGGLSLENVDFVTMPHQGAYAYSAYTSRLNHRYSEASYVVPAADELLDLVNSALSPYVEVFTLQDLDIMSVNADGSLRSTTGRLENPNGTYPSAHWKAQWGVGPSYIPPKAEEDIPQEPQEDISPETPGVSPEGGAAARPEPGAAPPADGGGNGDSSGPAPETPDAGAETPSGGDGAQTPLQPETPAGPPAQETPQAPVEPEFSIIEPPPAA